MTRKERLLKELDDALALQHELIGRLAKSSGAVSIILHLLAQEDSDAVA